MSLLGSQSGQIVEGGDFGINTHKDDNNSNWTRREPILHKRMFCKFLHILSLLAMRGEGESILDQVSLQLTMCVY